MKPAALLTAALLSVEATSIALPQRNQELEARDSLSPNGGEVGVVTPGLVVDGSRNPHLKKREWHDWVPSAGCLACIGACMARDLEIEKWEFIFKVTKLDVYTIINFNICASTCTLEGLCFGKNPGEMDPFLTQSEAGRITSQYKQNGMIEGAGASSPKDELR